MKTIQIFDPALCCSTGVCGVDVDQSLVTFSAEVAWAKLNGAQIERFNLAQKQVAFVENPAANHHTHSYAVVPLLRDEPVGIAHLLELSGHLRGGRRLRVKTY